MEKRFAAKERWEALKLMEEILGSFSARRIIA